MDWSLIIINFLAIPVCLLVGMVVSGLLVWKLRVRNYKKALLIGVGAVPFVMGAIIYAMLRQAHVTDSVMFFRIVFSGVGSGILGSYIGSGVAWFTYVGRSEQPEMQRAYREALEALSDNNSPPPFWSAGNALWKMGLSDTQSNVFLWRLGWLVCSLWVLAVMFWMAAGGLLDPERSTHLPLQLRMLAGTAPLAVPALLWGLTCRWWPALGIALRSGILITSLPLTLIYVLFNAVAAFRA